MLVAMPATNVRAVSDHVADLRYSSEHLLDLLWRYIQLFLEEIEFHFKQFMDHPVEFDDIP
jgi:hypothetical protein